MKHISKIAALTFALLSSAYALEGANVLKLVADLKSEDPKVRANAITELTPLYMEIEGSLKNLRQDKDPNVVLAFMAFSNKMAARYQKSPEGLDAQARVNEVYAVACCKAFCTAQDIYRRTDYNKDGVLEYAQSLKGDASLYENKAGAGDVCLIDKSFANAEGTPGKATPKAGYCFKVLTSQGKDAAGGVRTYISNSRMTLGYALVAYPAEYGKSGTKCFLVNNAGTIYQKDLGPQTLDAIEKMTEFNPDKTWIITE